MNKQKQYFINGLVLIILALLAITIIPFCADKLRIPVEKNIFSEFELFALMLCALFYLFSPKYYKAQILSIICAVIFYFVFIKIYSL